MRQLSYKDKGPILYLVATPIGNMKEMSTRATEILSSMDFIACEDTRNTAKLLNQLGIKKELISCHEHNEEEASEYIIKLLKENKSVAYVSDAGYPGISDPGERLVKKCLLNEIKVSTISGPCAFINALVASGLDTKHFYFHGFLNAKSSVRINELKELNTRKETLIFYESPHRIKKTLIDLHNVFGARKAVIARELTKIYEEYIRGNLEEFLLLDEASLIGEMVIIIEGNTNEEPIYKDKEDIIKMVQSFERLGYTTKDAIKKVSELLDISKNEIYRLYHNN